AAFQYRPYPLGQGRPQRAAPAGQARGADRIRGGFCRGGTGKAGSAGKIRKGRPQDGNGHRAYRRAGRAGTPSPSARTAGQAQDCPWTPAARSAHRPARHDSERGARLSPRFPHPCAGAGIAPCAGHHRQGGFLRERRRVETGGAALVLAAGIPLADLVLRDGGAQPWRGGRALCAAEPSVGRTAVTTPFGKAVRHLRERKGVSQKEMALALGVSAAYLSALEHGRRGMPSFDFLQRVAGYFNIIWDEAEDLFRIAQISDPRVVIDTAGLPPDRKSTRLNSSHVKISY